MAETPEEHLQWILARIGRTEVEERRVETAHGLALASDVAARLDLPIWDASAMDGYAVRAGDLAGAAPSEPALLRVVGEVAAGSGEDPSVAPGSAVRIMTGAPVPADADAVVPVEATRDDSGGAGWAGDVVRVLGAFSPGANVRRRGEDVGAGDTIARAGDRLGAARLSAIAAAGVGAVRVHRPPRIAVVSTGSELRPPGSALAHGQIPESNSILISGLLVEAGFEAATLEHRADDAPGLRDRLAELAASHDAVITTGGVGPGRHDVVRIALEGEPGIRSVRVAVRPGQPQCAGRHRAGAFVFGLPGNPVSAAVSFELFVRPALRALAGCARIHRRRLLATAAESWDGKAGRAQVVPVGLEEAPGGLVCRPSTPPARVSHSVGRHGATEGYAIVEAERGGVRAGETVTVIETGPA